jgi:3-oxoacyl-[acyl-carrier protein] reductase
LPFLNKTVLVTGSGRGIGKRLALGFAEQRAFVGLLARTRPELDVTLLEMQQLGGTGQVAPADVRILSQVEQAVALLPPVDELVCAAGIQGPIRPIAETDPARWVDTIQTNLIGIFHCLRAVIPQMAARRRGKIILIGGGGGVRARPNFSAYAAAKTGIVRLAETVAAELLHDNIQVNVMAPGGTYTAMTDEILQAGEAAAGSVEVQDARQIRLTGGVAPDKQIALAAFLASEASNHISGRLIHVNDDWKRLQNDALGEDLLMLRRIQRGDRS